MRPGPKLPFPPLIWPLFVSVMIAPALETPAPPGALLVAPPFPPMIVPLALLDRDPIVRPFAFDTPTPPPGAPAAPPAPLIDPLFISVETEQDKAFTPVGPPLMVPLLRTVIAPSVLKIGPKTAVEMVWSAPLQASAEPGAPIAASAMSEAPASSAVREPRPSLNVEISATSSTWPESPRCRRPLDFMPMDALPSVKILFYYLLIRHLTYINTALLVCRKRAASIRSGTLLLPRDREPFFGFYSRTSTRNIFNLFITAQ
jgi:hypothetical protein